MFRDKRGLRQECIDFRHESSGEHRKLQIDAASADTFDTVVRVAGLAGRNGFAHSLLLAGNTGTTFGMHAGRAQTLQCVHLQCR